MFVFRYSFQFIWKSTGLVPDIFHFLRGRFHNNLYLYYLCKQIQHYFSHGSNHEVSFIYSVTKYYCIHFLEYGSLHVNRGQILVWKITVFQCNLSWISTHPQKLSTQSWVSKLVKLMRWFTTIAIIWTKFGHHHQLLLKPHFGRVVNCFYH